MSPKLPQTPPSSIILGKATELGRFAERCDAALLRVEELLPRLRALQANRNLSPAEAQNLALKVGELERAETALQHQALEARSMEARARQVGEQALNPRGVSANELLRGNPSNEITPEQTQELTQIWESLGGDPATLRFNEGSKTGFLDETRVVNIRGDIFPNPRGMTTTATLDERVALAHELGHVHTAQLGLPPNSWQDEWTAANWAIENIPSLTEDERATLVADALDKARVQNAVPEFNAQLSDAMKALLY